MNKWVIGKWLAPSHFFLPGSFCLTWSGVLHTAPRIPCHPLVVLFFPFSTGRRPDQPGWGLPVRGEVDSLVQPPELQILEETEQGAQTSGSHGPHARTWKHGELGHSFAPFSCTCGTWLDGRKSLSLNWRWLDIRGGVIFRRNWVSETLNNFLKSHRLPHHRHHSVWRLFL